MASKGRRPVRATIKSAITGAVLYHTSLREADQRAEDGILAWSGSNTYTEVEGKSDTPNSPTILTEGDMHGVVQQHRRALQRFRNWHLVHDTRSVTVTADGRIWTPDPQVSAIRAKMREQEYLVRRQQERSDIRKRQLAAKSYANAHRN